MDVHVPCPCPGTPHPDGDTVTLRDKPTLRMGTQVIGLSSAQAQTGLPSAGDITELFVREGILAWTFVLEDGSPRPLDAEGIQWLVDDYAVAYPIAERASELYTEVIFAPLLAQATEPRRSSPTSRTGASTSASSQRSRKLQSVSASSSPDTSDGAP